jgi:hypothetical protein
VTDDRGFLEQSESPAVAGGAPSAHESQGSEESVPHRTRRAAIAKQASRLIEAIRKGDDAAIQEMVMDLSKQHRFLAPLAFVVGAFAMLFEGVKLLVTNWRLTLVQVLPAMWIWAAMIDLKAHVLHGKSFHVIRGPILIPIIVAIVAITAFSFFLNAVFAFAISRSGRPEIRPAFTEARNHLSTVLGSGAVLGLFLAFSTVIVVRWGHLWFAVALSIVVAAMMVSYVAIPSRLIGMKTTYSRRDKLTATAVGGALGAVVCSPPYLLGRIGLLLLGSHTLFILGVILLSVGLILQAGATSAVKTIKMSAKLVAGQKVDSPTTLDPSTPI